MNDILEMNEYIERVYDKIETIVEQMCVRYSTDCDCLNDDVLSEMTECWIDGYGSDEKRMPKKDEVIGIMINVLDSVDMF